MTPRWLDDGVLQDRLLIGITAFCCTLVPVTTRADSVPPQQSVENTAAPDIGGAASEQVADEGDDNAPSDLPPGHPPVDPTSAGMDSSGGMQRASGGTLIPSASVPAGTVEVHVTNDKNQSAAGITVILQTHRESVAEGNSDSQRDEVTDATGTARFSQLSNDSNLSYRLMLSYGGARYGIQPFQLPAGQGLLANMRQFALVRDAKQAMVASESMVFVEPKDDVFQFDVVYRLYNVGQTIWVPSDAEVPLPSGKQAFNTQQSADDIRVESSSGGVRLVGSVPPGQHEVAYTFQVPRRNTSSASFEIGTPPNTMQARVGVAGGRNTELTVEGFPEAQPTTAQNGQRLLLAVQSFERATRLPSDLRFEIRGLPTLGSGRIVAASCAALVALLGLGFAITRYRRGLDASDTQLLEERARNRLLEELAELESARTTGTIGPRTYEETRSTLVEALVRLEPITE